MRSAVLLMLGFFLVSAACFGQVDPLVENGTREEVVFTLDQDKRSLEQIRKEIAERGIHLKYDDLQFGSQGQLHAITFSVKDMTDSVKHASSQDISKQVLFGFEFYHEDGKALVTRIGEMSDPSMPPGKH